jgi:hypothetical protein
VHKSKTAVAASLQDYLESLPKSRGLWERYRPIRGLKKGLDLQSTGARHVINLCAKKGHVERLFTVKMVESLNSFNSLCRYCNSIGQIPCRAKIRYRAGVKGIVTSPEFETHSSLSPVGAHRHTTKRSRLHHRRGHLHQTSSFNVGSSLRLGDPIIELEHIQLVDQKNPSISRPIFAFGWTERVRVLAFLHRHCERNWVVEWKAFCLCLEKLYCKSVML